MSQTDFTMIKAGSFLKANGGYLVINALDALIEPGVWPTLKRTLRNQIFEIQNYLQMYLFTSARLKPEPIKADVKVVMIGDAYIYNLLYFQDEDFKKIFKIKAEFDSEMDKAEKTVRRLRPVHQEDLRRGRPAAVRPGGHRRPSSSTRRASPGGRRSCRRGSTSSPTSSAKRATGPRRNKKPAVGREDIEKAIARAVRAGQPDRGQDPGDDRGGDHPHRHRGRRGRPGQRPVGLRHGRVHVRQAGPHHGPDGHGPGRGHQHRARGRPERPDPQQGRPHPRRLPARESTPPSGRCP